MLGRVDVGVSSLVMECWRMALSKVKGEGVVRMADQSSFRICLHLGATGRSHSGVELMFRLCSGHCSGSVEDKSARKHARAASSGCGRGVRMVEFAHCNSLSSRNY